MGLLFGKGIGKEATLVSKLAQKCRQDTEAGQVPELAQRGRGEGQRNPMKGGNGKMREGRNQGRHGGHSHAGSLRSHSALVKAPVEGGRWGL